MGGHNGRERGVGKDGRKKCEDNTIPGNVGAEFMVLGVAALYLASIIYGWS